MKKWPNEAGPEGEGCLPTTLGTTHKPLLTKNSGTRDVAGLARPYSPK